MAKVIMPQLGESVTEGTIGRWLKKPGDRVELYEPLVEVITDKVNVEIPSPAAGVLKEVLVPEGATVPVRTDLAVIQEAGVPAGRSERPSAAPAEAGPAPAAARAHGAPEPAAILPRKDQAGAEPHISPVVRRLAAEHGIDVSAVKGTGFGGRVTREDVLRYAQERQKGPAAPAAPPAPTAAQPPVPAPGAPPIVALPGDQAIPASPVRRQIAEHMARSTRTAPHAWTMLEVDMSGVVKLREALKEEFCQREGIELTYVPFVVKAVAEGLKEQPLMNSVWAEDRLIVRKEINIGVAVARDEGLIVPVVRHADQKSIAGLAKALHELVQRARENRLTLQDVQGGTFTLNNPGALGSVASFSIINYPQAAILNMEAIVRRPVVVDDAVAVRPMMNLTLSFDHRAVDGHTVLQFLQKVKRTLEAMGPGTPVY